MIDPSYLIHKYLIISNQKDYIPLDLRLFLLSDIIVI